MNRILIFLSFVTAICSADTALEKRVHDLIKETELAEGITDIGVGVAIVKDDRVILSKGYGWKDRANKKPVTERTLFGIASTTKAFTAVALSMLEEEGKLELAAPLKRYLPDLTFQSPEAEAQGNLIDLLAHRMGMPRHDIMWYVTPFDRTEVLRRLQYLAFHPDPAMGFRKAFQYNNLMYTLAGRVLEQQAGTSWEAFMEQRIFSPLEMSDTQTHVAQSLASDDYAVPYYKDNAIALRPLEKIGPAGSINSNLVDLSKWVRFLLNRGKTPRGDSLLSESKIAALFEPRVTISEEGNFKYGLGWFLEEVGGKRFIWHAGNIDGYTTHISLLPEQGIGIVILSNQNGLRHSPLAKRIYAAVSEGQWDLEGSPLFERGPASDLGLGISSHHKPRPPCSGTRFENAGYGEIKTCKDTRNFWLHYYDNRWKLEPTSEADKYQVTVELFGGGLIVKVPVEFRTKGGAPVEALLPFEPSLGPIVFQRIRE